jgi:hypothetical protein
MVRNTACTRTAGFAPPNWLFRGFGFCPFRGRVSSLQPPVTRAVETVEKVPFQKLIIEKWDRNIEKHLVFCVPHNILAIFKPNVGDFYEDFSIKGFFDSLVRRVVR